MGLSIRPGIYEHFKGNRYEVVQVVKHSETLEHMVVYRALYGTNETWVRPISMFMGTVERDGAKFPRFKYIGEKSV